MYWLTQHPSYHDNMSVGAVAGAHADGGMLIFTTYQVQQHICYRIILDITAYRISRYISYHYHSILDITTYSILVITAY